MREENRTYRQSHESSPHHLDYERCITGLWYHSMSGGKSSCVPSSMASAKSPVRKTRSDFCPRKVGNQPCCRCRFCQKKTFEIAFAFHNLVGSAFVSVVVVVAVVLGAKWTSFQMVPACSTALRSLLSVVEIWRRQLQGSVPYVRSSPTRLWGTSQGRTDRPDCEKLNTSLYPDFVLSPVTYTTIQPKAFDESTQNSPHVYRQTSAQKAVVSDKLLREIESGDVVSVRALLFDYHKGLKDPLVDPSEMLEHRFRTPFMVILRVLSLSDPFTDTLSRVPVCTGVNTT